MHQVSLLTWEFLDWRRVRQHQQTWFLKKLGGSFKNRRGLKQIFLDTSSPFIPAKESLGGLSTKQKGTTDGKDTLSETAGFWKSSARYSIKRSSWNQYMSLKCHRVARNWRWSQSLLGPTAGILYGLIAICGTDCWAALRVGTWSYLKLA